MDSFLETPERIVDLSRAELGALFLKSQTLSAAVLARLLCDDDRSAATREASAGGDRLLTADEAAAMLAVPRAFLYRNGKRLGLTVELGPGTLRYSHATIQNYMRVSRAARVK